MKERKNWKKRLETENRTCGEKRLAQAGHVRDLIYPTNQRAKSTGMKAGFVPPCLDTVSI